MFSVQIMLLFLLLVDFFGLNNGNKINLMIQLENHTGVNTMVMTCCADKEPIGNSANFIFNELENEVRYSDNECYHKERECEPKTCNCSRDTYSWTVYKTQLRRGDNVSCLMRFEKDNNNFVRNNSTLVYNGTGFWPITEEDMSEKTRNETSGNKTKNDVVEEGSGEENWYIHVIYAVVCVMCYLGGLITQSIRKYCSSIRRRKSQNADLNRKNEIEMKDEELPLHNLLTMSDPSPVFIPPRSVSKVLIPCNVSQDFVPYKGRCDIAPRSVSKDLIPYKERCDNAPCHVSQNIAPCHVFQDFAPRSVSKDLAPVQVSERGGEHSAICDSD